MDINHSELDQLFARVNSVEGIRRSLPSFRVARIYKGRGKDVLLFCQWMSDGMIETRQARLRLG